MSDKYTKDTDKRFTLRIDNNLFEIVKTYAQINRRPVGSEIEYALGRYYAGLIKDMTNNSIYPTIINYLAKYDPSLTDFQNNI